VVVACAIPSLDVKLIEAHRRRAAFLELTVERLALENAQVLIEQVNVVDVVADVCFSRAFAPLPAAWDACRRILRPGGRLVVFAGRSFQADTSLPDARSEELLEAPLLESSGPLVIMTRQ
jgi:16S rRNA G527 N7-methylase RsmG